MKTCTQKKPHAITDMKENKNTDSTIVGSMNHIYFIGWKIDESVMNVFKQCWPVMEKLHTIK